MSCYNEESGFVTLTKKDFNDLRKLLTSRFSAPHAAAIDICLPTWRDVKKKSKGTHVEYSSILCMAIARLNEYEKKNNVRFSSFYRSYIINMVTSLIHSNLNFNNKITKADVVNNLGKVNTRTDTFQLFGSHGHSVGEIRFNREKNTVYYDVFENNRAVEDAKSSPMGKMFFHFLDSVKWTKKTGGQFKYSDEYMREEGICDTISRSYGNPELYK